MGDEGAGRRGERVAGGRYRLLDVLGHGGMGVVWRAHDEALGREVAIKEVRAPAGLGDRDIGRLYARLEREGRAAARVSHRNVVTVHDVALEDGRPWIVMELVRGLSLAEVLDAEGHLPPARAAFIGAEVLTALRAAHAVGVLHRDVKPGNVLIANDGRVVLTDFGIAAVEGDAATLTLTGELVGSPEFLAPERALGEPPGPGADLWSLGVLLYAAVEGVSPFRQDTPLSTLRAVVDASLPEPRRAGPLTSVLEGLLHKDPGRRLAAAEAERLLRLVAAGGTPRPSSGPVSVPVSAPVPASAGSDPDGPDTAPFRLASVKPSAPVPPPRSDDAPRPDHRSRGAAAALVVGALLAGVALGGVTWALLDDGDGGGDGGTTPGGGGSSHSTAPAAQDPDRPASDDDAGKEATASRPADGASSTERPSLTITIIVKAARGSYQGACPPPEGEAPSFTATVTVNRAPTTVEYRWITGSGEVADPGWKKLEFTGGATGSSRTVRHTEAAPGARKDWIAVETRGRDAVTSRKVSFTVVCEEAPTDGASSSASSSPSAEGG
ncbi:protein kinase domain-containing protein [Streptomyces cucumeris]|uniref:serine/threonine-protein kinase n=1 Tax=Streptomyces cucumeris TaxID=2962890 RepID=UPI003D74ED17